MARNYDQNSATLIHVHLTRPASSDSPADPAAWGFRLLQTGNGVGVQQVQRGTLADICGLLAGDDILEINSRNTATMSLEEARGAIAQAGNDVELLVQRGPTRLWQPQVTYNQPAPHVLSGAHPTNRAPPHQSRHGGGHGGHGGQSHRPAYGASNSTGNTGYNVSFQPNNTFSGNGAASYSLAVQPKQVKIWLSLSISVTL